MKGTVVIILPKEVDYRFFRGFQLPREFNKYLDGTVNILVLPKGGSIHIGKVGVDVIDSLHRQIHEIRGGHVT